MTECVSVMCSNPELSAPLCVTNRLPLEKEKRMITTVLHEKLS